MPVAIAAIIPYFLILRGSFGGRSFQYPKGSAACAVGIADQYRGETVKAYIVLRPGEASTPEEIIAFCREKLAAYKVPKLVEFRSSLPKSAIGKVLRKILREEEAKKKGNPA